MSTSNPFSSPASGEGQEGGYEITIAFHEVST